VRALDRHQVGDPVAQDLVGLVKRADSGGGDDTHRFLHRAQHVGTDRHHRADRIVHSRQHARKDVIAAERAVDEIDQSFGFQFARHGCGFCGIQTAGRVLVRQADAKRIPGRRHSADRLEDLTTKAHAVGMTTAVFVLAAIGQRR